jgi:hypothetical protein
MSVAAYSLEALREYRRRKAEAAADPPKAHLTLKDIPPEAPMEEGIVFGCWNGEAFVSWEKWLATTPIAVQTTEQNVCLPDGARCITAECGSTKVWLAKEGDRWLMYANSRRASDRRKDFASPFLEHAVRTAEQWYGAPVYDWHEERP